jgi:acetylornithine deacetylase
VEPDHVGPVFLFMLNDADESEFRSLLTRCLQFQSVSGHERVFTEFIADWARDQGFTVDLWQSNESDLAQFPVARAKHIALANRPTLVIKFPKNGKNGRSILFNAHADVVAAPHPDQWRFDPWSGKEHAGRFYGRGACDVKGPLVSALWAMQSLRVAHPDGLDGDVMLELIPGEEDCVTLGTVTSVARGYTADACIVLEPTESLPRNASRPGCRFEITCSGKSVHGTVKWLGEDAIELGRIVLDILPVLQGRWNDRAADPLFASYPIARPVTVDLIRGGDWQGMISDRCLIAGYLELLPADEPAAWRERFNTGLRGELTQRGQDDRRISICFPEEYAGHWLSDDYPLCRTALGIVEDSRNLLQNIGLQWNGWQGFNSGCEAGLRAGLLGTPTLVWGPGSLAQAHAVDEFVEFSQVRAVAGMFARSAQQWTGGKKD